MIPQEIADVKLALEQVASFSKYPRPSVYASLKVLIPCAREHKCNAEWAETCNRLEKAGVLKPFEKNIWYTT